MLIRPSRWTPAVRFAAPLTFGPFVRTIRAMNRVYQSGTLTLLVRADGHARLIRACGRVLRSGPEPDVRRHAADRYRAHDWREVVR